MFASFGEHKRIAILGQFAEDIFRDPLGAVVILRERAEYLLDPGIGRKARSVEPGPPFEPRGSGDARLAAAVSPSIR